MKPKTSFASVLLIWVVNTGIIFTAVLFVTIASMLLFEGIPTGALGGLFLIAAIFGVCAVETRAIGSFWPFWARHLETRQLRRQAQSQKSESVRPFGRSLLPILTVLLAILLLWYAAAVKLNAAWTYDQAARAGSEVTFSTVLKDTMAQERPVLPAPHQVAKGLWDGLFGQKFTAKKSLVYHGWYTFSATMVGFLIGTGLGILLAVGIIHSRAMDLSVMPWAIASQTIPILAIAPMIIVVLASQGITGLLPKAIISAYLSFFPVVVGMVKGLRSPDQMQLDQLKTYSASRNQTFWKLRLPASMPYLFASLKVSVAASLVGAIVGELPSGATVGLGARLLSGSYYGQTIQIWAALFAAAILAAGLVMIVGLIEGRVLKRMGMAR